MENVTLKLITNVLESMDLQEETDNLQHEDRNLLTVNVHSETWEEEFNDHLDWLDFEDFYVIFVD